MEARPAQLSKKQLETLAEQAKGLFSQFLASQVKQIMKDTAKTGSPKVGMSFQDMEDEILGISDFNYS